MVKFTERKILKTFMEDNTYFAEVEGIDYMIEIQKEDINKEHIECL